MRIDITDSLVRIYGNEGLVFETPRFIGPAAYLRKVDIATWVKEYSAVMERVLNTNTSAGAYHTTHHLFGTAVLAYAVAKLDGCVDADMVGVAGLLHDYRHPATSDDSINIAATLDAIGSDPVILTLFTPGERSLVYDLINQTYWPLPEHVLVSPAGAALRAADQLYATFYFTPEMSSRLYSELGPRFSVGNYPDWLIRNVEYNFSLCGTLLVESANLLYAEALQNAVVTQLKELHDYKKR